MSEPTTPPPPDDMPPAPEGSAAPPPPDAAAPPPGAAPPPPPPPGYYATAPGGQLPLSQSDERLWAMLAHLSGLVISIIGPLIILLTLGKRSAFVDDQSKEALNFQITVLIASIISAILIIVVIGIVLLVIVGIGALVLMIIAAVKSYQGELYRYPVNIRLVK